MYVHEARNQNVWILSVRKQRHGFTRTGASVYVAREDCETLNTQEIFYAMCLDDYGLYGQVGTNSNLCGTDTKQYEDSFFAYVGSMFMDLFLPFLTFYTQPIWVPILL